MGNIINLATETVPAWYELTLVNPTTIGLRVHRLALANLQKLDWTAINHRFTKPLIAPGEKNCGLNSAFISANSGHEDWIMWQFSLPQDEDKASDIRITFDLFVGYLSMCGGLNTGWSDQLMFIENFCAIKHASFSATFSPAVIAWLAIPENRNALDSVSQAMGKAFAHIWQDRYDGWGFAATCNDGRFLHLLPGERGGLDPKPNSSSNPNYGYELITHNVDTWMVQLSLLAGLAKLHDLIRVK